MLQITPKTLQEHISKNIVATVKLTLAHFSTPIPGCPETENKWCAIVLEYPEISVGIGDTVETAVQEIIGRLPKAIEDRNYYLANKVKTKGEKSE